MIRILALAVFICLLTAFVSIQSLATHQSAKPIIVPPHQPWQSERASVDTTPVVLLAATGDRTDPYGSFNFILEIDGLGEVGGFLSVDGLESCSEVIQYRNGDEDITPRKLPGKTHYANLVLRRGLTANTDLWNWRKSVTDGKTERKGGAIIIRDEAREEAVRFTFREAWPCRYRIEKLDATQKGIAIEVIELVVEELKLES